MRLYKLGKTFEFKGIKLDTVNVPTDQVEEYKAKGWGCAWDILKESQGVKKEEPPVATAFEQVDTNKIGKLSADEVRTAAKEAGLEGWDKKRIKTLIKELGLSDGDE